MSEEQQPKDEQDAGSGRVVYSRLPTAVEEDARAAAERPAAVTVSLPSFAREPLAPTLPTLVVAFVLLVLLVLGLGYSSVSKVESVSEEVQRRDQQLADRTQLLNNLRSTLAQLDTEARERGTRQLGGGIVNPFDRKLRSARGDVEKQLYLFDHLPLAQDERGKVFRADVAKYVESTNDAEQYTIEGFKNYRPVAAGMEVFFAQVNKEQEDLQRQRLMLSNESARRIRLLTWIAALFSALIAAATIWEVQRRFRQMRRSLEESRRERLFSSQMLEGMVSAVAAVDGRGALRSANAAFFRLFPDAAVGAPVGDASHAPDAAKLFAAAAGAARAEHVTYHGRWTLTDAEGEERTFEVYASPLELDGGHGQIMSLVDVTKTVATETELRHKASLAAVGQAAAQVAHEIKNPLGSIRLGVAMLRDMTQPGEAHDTIDLVERGIDHLNKLTVDVTNFSRGKELSLERANLHELLDASLELVAEQIRAKHAPVERHYTSESLAGQLDADQLRQVFVNLLANALDAGEENSPVSITTALVAARASGGNGDGGGAAGAPRARVTIADRGRGMDAKTRARIFEPFYTTKKRGTGLGLAIVKKIVEQHGGTIAVESAAGEGTRFHVELPLAQT
ncbi:MAG: two-component system, NtrC family, sensor histidine kinase HydH [Pyrinomonadaceae bacterium]|jgi:signal transduction histidine kinase|nr:two-component system, NtrC family, sensor histidine kinase HydH [Pyrinomonadaceae bacterium]